MLRHPTDARIVPAHLVHPAILPLHVYQGKPQLATLEPGPEWYV